MRFLSRLAALVLTLAPVAALSQSAPNLVTGQVPTAAQWNSYFAAKQDYNPNLGCAFSPCVPPIATTPNSVLGTNTSGTPSFSSLLPPGMTYPSPQFRGTTAGGILSGNFSLSTSGQAQITNTTPSTSSTTGAVTIAGGLGVGGNLNVGGTISGSVIPSGGNTASPLSAILGRTVNVLDYGAVPSASTDNSTAINNAINAAVAAGGGSVILPKGTYGVCASPVNLTYSGAIHVNLIGDGATITLQTGCATPPQEIVYVNPPASNTIYSNHPTIQGLTIDGACTTKYVMYVVGNGLVMQNNIVQNPAPNATISGSAGIYMGPGVERNIGASNWVVAVGNCYNTGNLPDYGIIDDTGGGNDNFTGVIVVNFITGIQSNGGDNFFGPGTHVWGGCYLQSSGGPCTFNAALRTTVGINLTGAGIIEGAEVDDAVSVGYALNGSSSNDHMIVIGSECLYSQTPTTSQYCATNSSTAVGSLMIGIVAPQLQSVYPQHIAYPNGTGITVLATPYVNNYINGSTAVTCSGSPSTSFAVTNGIVTHC